MPTTASLPTALILDDHKIVVQGLSTMFKLHFGVQPTIASSAQEALTVVRHQRFDIALLDLELPDGHGLAVAEALSRDQPKCALIVVSGHVDQLYCPADLRRRLTAVISKTEPLHELRAVITRVLKSQGKNADAIDSLATLTPRETDVYRLIGTGLNCKQIATELGLTLRTVESHRKSIASKLLMSGAELVHRATLDRLSQDLEQEHKSGPCPEPPPALLRRGQGG